MSRWVQVDDWLQRLLEVEPQVADGPARREVWRDAIARIQAGLEVAAAVEGEPYRTATFVSARTVFTAPIEWCALLLGHGTEVNIKHPAGLAGVTPQLVEAAHAVGLPLSATDDRGAIHGAELVIAMGSDASVDAIGADLDPGTTGLLFGHRFSAAWVGDDRMQAWADVADALWPFDSRGCLSPQVVLTPVPLADAVRALANAVGAMARTRPRGIIGPAEGAQIRARGALARVTGIDRTTLDWAVHGLPGEHWHPEALPYAIAVVQVHNPAQAAQVLGPWSRWLSTVGDDEGGLWFDARVCPIREMQRPPLDRQHDGVDVLTAVLRPRRETEAR